MTWGRAYRLPPPGADRDAALAYLERRECQYDVRLRADLYATAAGDEAPVITRALLCVSAERVCCLRVLTHACPGARSYVASTDPTHNRNYLGPADLPAVAATVAVARGPSGDNCEYVYNLAQAMRALGVVDDELFRLEALVRRLRGEDAAAAGSAAQPAQAAPAEAAAGERCLECD